MIAEYINIAAHLFGSMLLFLAAMKLWRDVEYGITVLCVAAVSWEAAQVEVWLDRFGYTWFVFFNYNWLDTLLDIVASIVGLAIGLCIIYVFFIRKLK